MFEEKLEWLLFTSIGDCKAFVIQINENRVNDGLGALQLGYPIILNNGNVAQFVGGCDDHLTQDEKDVRVKASDFEGIIKSHYMA